MKRFAAGLALLLSVTACGKPSASTPTTTTGKAASTASTRPPPTTKPAQHRRVGSIDAVQPKGGSVDGVFAVTDGALLEQSTLDTDPQGVVDFHLDKKLRACRAKEGSQAQVSPSSGILIDFKLGVFLCGTTTSGPLATYLGGAGHTFLSNDPVFIVRAQPNGDLRIEVASGFIGLPGPGGVTVVGPGEAADVTADHGPVLSPFDRSQLDAADQAFLNQLMQVPAPVPQYPVAQNGASPTLSRAAALGHLNVAVTESAAGPVSAFTQRLLDQFVRAWGVSRSIKISATTMSADRAQFLLAAHELDLVITDTPPPGNWVPLVQDDLGKIWYNTYDASDKELDRLLTQATQTSLIATCPSAAPITTAAPNPSCYETLRADLLTTEPAPLSAFGSLLGLEH